MTNDMLFYLVFGGILGFILVIFGVVFYLINRNTEQSPTEQATPHLPNLDTPPPEGLPVIVDEPAAPRAPGTHWLVAFSAREGQPKDDLDDLADDLADDRDHPAGIYLMYEDGSNLRRITDPALGACSYPIWSPDGTRLAFACYTADKRFSIYTYELATGNLTCITPAGGNDFPHVWLPSDDIILETIDNPQLWTMHSDGSNRHHLTALTGYWDHTWSNDRQFVLMVGGGGGNQQLFVAAADGTKLRPLTNDDRQKSTPKLSPDQNWIAFASGDELYVSNLEGTQTQRLDTLASILTTDEVTWSPDSTRLVYGSYANPGGNPHNNPQTLCIINRDGSNRRILVFLEREEFSLEGDELYIVWTPDGEYILFIAPPWDEAFYQRHPDADHSYQQIHRIGADGSGLRRLTGYASLFADVSDLSMQPRSGVA